MQKILLQLSICGVLFCPISLAAQPETAKILTEDAPTVAQGVTEFELSYGYSSADKAFNDSNNTVDRRSNYTNAIDAKVSYGFLDNLDGAISFGWADLKDHDEPGQDGDGLGDISLISKWNFYRAEDENLLISYSPSITAPIGDDSDERSLGPSQEYWSFNQLLIFTLISDQTNVNFDIGYVLAFGEDREDSRGEFVSNIAAGYQLCPGFQPIVELNYLHGYFDNAGDADELAITAGAVSNINDSLRLDIGFTQAVYGRNADRATAFLVNLSLST